MGVAVSLFKNKNQFAETTTHPDYVLLHTRKRKCYAPVSNKLLDFSADFF